ncbi:MAG TPA: Fe-S cluster assembly scaffold protein NifU [Thermodesulfobacteriota bacterium]|nr:Fe-S cluster assembly scaffold protein NifU [Thermodesulfobacteriota bacterium]
MYSEKVMEHFKNPRNVGVIEGADGVGEVGNPVCGDMMTFYIKVKGEVIDDVKFQTFGCGAAIAVSSMVSEMARGKTIDEASRITNKMVAEALEGLPKQKMHCSNLGADALHKAIEDYQSRQKGVTARPEPKKCYCPVCDLQQPNEAEYCTGCGRDLLGEPEHAH